MMKRSLTGALLLLVTVAVNAPAWGAERSSGAGVVSCAGDCDGDEHVRLDELVTAANVALALFSIEACSAIDPDGNGRATVDELVAAVSNSIYGCGVIPPTSTPTRTPTTTPTATVTATPAAALGQFGCDLDPAASSFRINIALGSGVIPINGVNATLAVDCGAIDGGTGDAPCAARLTSFDPVNVLGIGFACVTPVENCPDGVAACDGAAGLDLDLIQEHNIGSCDGNAGCVTACTAHCEGLGREFFDSGCEGFCEGGPNDGAGCTVDADCPDAVCVGQDPITHGNICNCQCLATSGATSPPGAMLLNIGARIQVEPALPCGDGDATISLPPICIPLTTETTAGVILQANNVPTARIGPLSDTGARLTCEDLAADLTAGLGLVGNIAVFDSTLGDLAIEIDWACQ